VKAGVEMSRRRLVDAGEIKVPTLSQQTRQGLGTLGSDRAPDPAASADEEV
jgi:hypothetical protein